MGGDGVRAVVAGENDHQLLIIGDPLCQPWAVRPKITVQGVKANQAVKGRLTLRALEKGDAKRVGRFEWYLDGLAQATSQPGGTFELDTASLGDGYHEVRAVGVTADAVETRGELVVPFRASNRGRSVTWSTPPPATACWGRALRLALKAPGARRIEIVHCRRVLTEIAGESGRGDIDPFVLGLGKVRLQAIAHYAGRERAFSQPVEIEIVPPAPMPATALPKGGRLSDGFTLTQQGEKPVIVQQIETSRAREHIRQVKLINKTLNWVKQERRWLGQNKDLLKDRGGWVRERTAWLDEQSKTLTERLKELKHEFLWTRKTPDWLAKTGMEAGRPFVIEAWFQAGDDGVHQFQMRTNANVRIWVDGKELRQRGRFWRFMPVPLAKGLHGLKVQVRCDKPAMLDLRFGGLGAPKDRYGGPGVRPIDGKRFRHPASPDEATSRAASQPGAL